MHFRLKIQRLNTMSKSSLNFKSEQFSNPHFIRKHFLWVLWFKKIKANTCQNQMIDHVLFYEHIYRVVFFFLMHPLDTWHMGCFFSFLFFTPPFKFFHCNHQFLQCDVEIGASLKDLHSPWRNEGWVVWLGVPHIYLGSISSTSQPGLMFPNVCPRSPDSLPILRKGLSSSLVMGSSFLSGPLYSTL